ncbi:MAG: response regulator [Bacteroidota bacterium]
MQAILKILILEDTPSDIDMVGYALKKQNIAFEFCTAMSREGFLQGLDRFAPDLILSDNCMPQFSATEALLIVQERSLDIPFILVTGTVSEEFAASIIKLGADDYILKDRLARLPSAIDNALKQRRTEKEKQEAEQKLLDQKIQEQKKITRAIIKAQEKERNHIGQELHDNVNQILAGVKIYLDRAWKNDPAMEPALHYPIELLGVCMDEIRLLGRKLVTPHKDVNVQELIRSLLQSLKENANIETSLVYDVSSEIDEDLNLNIYRIIQEQVSNIIKHSGAHHVSVWIKTDPVNISIVVTDDGQGFDPNEKRKGIGLSNIVNRVASFNGETAIETAPGKGCTIRIIIPH